MRDPHDEHDADTYIGSSARRPLRPNEYPDDADLEDDLDDTEPCPHCGRRIYADGDWCPRCGHGLDGGRSAVLPTWAVVTAVLVLLAFVLVLLAR